PELLLPLDVNCAVSPQRGQITHLNLRGVNTSQWPTVHPFTPNYMTPFDGGRIAVGATRETGSGYDPRVTAAGQLQVLRDALDLAPGLADATVIETRVGIRPMGDDNLPIAGEVPDRSGLSTMTGYGAGGLTLGPLLGDAVARSILGNPAPELTAFPTATPMLRGLQHGRLWGVRGERRSDRPTSPLAHHQDRHGAPSQVDPQLSVVAHAAVRSCRRSGRIRRTRRRGPARSSPRCPIPAERHVSRQRIRRHHLSCALHIVRRPIYLRRRRHTEPRRHLHRHRVP